MAALASAIERRDWDAAALYLVLGVARAARWLPQGTANDLLAALAEARRGGDG
jgi:hypothetical protein